MARLWSAGRGRELPVLGAAPIVAIAYAERRQLAFLASSSRATAGKVLVEQWFGGAGITYQLQKEGA